MRLSFQCFAQDDDVDAQTDNSGDCFITVEENGETVVSCTGVEFDLVDCSGNDLIVPTDTPHRVRRLDNNACETDQVAPGEASEFEEAQLEIDDLLLASDGPVPGGGGPTSPGARSP